jgi:hypothetical protein
MRGLALIALATALLASFGVCGADPAGVPCCGVSWLVPENGFPCVGDAVDLDILVCDCYGTPLPGIIVSVRSSRGSDDVISGSPDTTDVNGHAEASITSMVAGQSWLSMDFEAYGFGCDDIATIDWNGASGAAATVWGTIKGLYR